MLEGRVILVAKVDKAGQDWNDLVTERAGIMQHEGGMPDPLARRRAWQDTTEAFGPCPVEPLLNPDAWRAR